MKIIIRILLIPILILFFQACFNDLPLNKDLTKKNYTFLNQDSAAVNFPEIIKGKITVMGFIYTHCPDICPMTTHNMALTEESLIEEGIDDVLFVALSFDPERDSPEVLRKFAEIRDIKFDNWIFLTGDELTTKDVLKRFDVRAIPTDSSFFEDGTNSYSIMHTDRISLINNKGILKKNYKGSTINIEELITDIKYLGE
ncbi:MAG: SCO family protein [Ignavibacteria bacterium]|nr:SCO family protein [Ignavibacteria bacterium]